MPIGKDPAEEAELGAAAARSYNAAAVTRSGGLVKTALEPRFWLRLGRGRACGSCNRRLRSAPRHAGRVGCRRVCGAGTRPRPSRADGRLLLASRTVLF